jgi:hypothetical protein
MFRLAVAPSAGFDYLDDGDDVGGPNLHKQPPRKAIINMTALIMTHPSYRRLQSVLLLGNVALAAAPLQRQFQYILPLLYCKYYAQSLFRELAI